MTDKKRKQKATLSARVHVDMKKKYDEKAKSKGVSTSEYLANVLVKFEEQKEQIKKLEKELDERNGQMTELFARLEKEQDNVSEAQDLQQKSEERNRILQDKRAELMTEQKQLVADVQAEKEKGLFARIFNRS